MYKDPQTNLYRKLIRGCVRGEGKHPQIDAQSHVKNTLKECINANSLNSQIVKTYLQIFWIYLTSQFALCSDNSATLWLSYNQPVYADASLPKRTFCIFLIRKLKKKQSRRKYKECERSDLHCRRHEEAEVNDFTEMIRVVVSV